MLFLDVHGKTRQIKIRNDTIGESVRVTSIVENMIDNRDKWFVLEKKSFQEI